MRTILMYVLLVHFKLQLLAFSLTQLFYCIAYLLVIYTLHRKRGATINDFLPGKIKFDNEEFYLFKEQKANFWSFTFLQLLKFLLTEGEKIVMIYISPIVLLGFYGLGY